MVVDDSWKPYVPPEEGAPEEEEVKDDDSGVDVEDVACSICGVFESTEDNDIIMCDRTNCFRAFHVNCTDPPMTEEERTSNKAFWKSRAALLDKLAEEWFNVPWRPLAEPVILAPLVFFP